jgi:hypothetical protein
MALLRDLRIVRLQAPHISLHPGRHKDLRQDQNTNHHVDLRTNHHLGQSTDLRRDRYTIRRPDLCKARHLVPYTHPRLDQYISLHQRPYTGLRPFQSIGLAATSSRLQKSKHQTNAKWVSWDLQKMSYNNTAYPSFNCALVFYRNFSISAKSSRSWPTKS